MRSPRIPNYNYSGNAFGACTKWPPGTVGPNAPAPTKGPSDWWGGTDFHELVSCQPHFDDEDEQAIDKLARKRCQTLLSVDDSYVGILNAVEEMGQLDNTYVLITSDHGYNLGHHMLPSNKFLTYEHSSRIPMLFAGPGIKANSTTDFLGTQVDLAPTMLGLAGLDTPAYMDGRSLVPLLVEEEGGLPGSVRRHLARNPAPPVRDAQFLEYYNQGPWEWNTRHPLDDWSNTYIGVRYKAQGKLLKYAIYDPYGKQNGFSKPQMWELFDLVADPYELKNIYNSTMATTEGRALVAMLEKRTREYYACAGSTCP